jgi:VWFA-related protein
MPGISSKHRRGAFAFVIAAPALLGLALFAQELAHYVGVVNVEVPVRVYKGDTFVDHLTLDDFLVYDDGKLQQIEAVYLVKKTDIARGEGQKGGPPLGVKPLVARQFVLFFELSDYLSELDRTIDIFFDRVLLPGDNLMIVTPMKNYSMRAEALARKPKETVKEDLRAILRRDILIGGAEYRTTIDDMFRELSRKPAGEPDLPLDQKFMQYDLYLQKLENLRKVDEKSLIGFASLLKGMPGQKYVYMFYQRENIPQFSPRAEMMTMAANNDVVASLGFLQSFQLFSRDPSFNVDAVKKAYADSSIAVHFLYLTKMPAGKVSVNQYKLAEQGGSLTDEVILAEKSEDIYSAFNEVARATGGISDSSSNAAAAFTRAVDASENYYLLYFKPRDAKPDGRFHEITVKVKSGSYRITHRAGYFATQ